MKHNPIRGFRCLIGETIKKIDATCCNSVRIECESGKIVELETAVLKLQAKEE